MSTCNEIMFKCQKDILKDHLSIRTLVEVSDFIIAYEMYGDNEEKSGINSSADNIETILQWCKMFSPYKLKKLKPLGKHASKNWFDAIYFTYVKYKLGKPLYFIVVLDVFIAATKPGKINISTWKWERDTSGRCKAYFKMLSHNMTWTKAVVEWINSKSSYYQDWGNIFTIYHGAEHEITLLVKERENRNEN